MAPANGGSAQLWLPLLFISLRVMLTATQKSVVTLNPPWIRIFTGEKVTLICNGNNLQENSTKWFHNDTISTITTSHWDIVSATIQDSGKYICQNQGFFKSKPVYLEVTRDWLLLQTSADMVLYNKSFDIRCHGWNNWTLRKVIYYKDDLAFKYTYETPKISIRNAKLNDSGTYYCSGCLRRLNYTSEKLRITVIKVYKPKYRWLQLIVPFLVAILFAVDTVLLFSTQEQFKLLMKIRKTGKCNKP
ncbi:high affinity immunoglobulin epsilon receptor subunit alpha [Peromyscus leucopus]|uniref:high affinity immunoglobulin epsilon receptor subunit alpha n=1 Tax=Peromyscus leucopus TaxID=10041 RepID=UPI0010A1D382|nr:high affinity immunoglobulin epsilon receptor subunit alpha [Peromyscus leucopus]